MYNSALVLDCGAGPEFLTELFPLLLLKFTAHCVALSSSRTYERGCFSPNSCHKGSSLSPWLLVLHAQSSLPVSKPLGTACLVGSHFSQTSHMALLSHPPASYHKALCLVPCLPSIETNRGLDSCITHSAQMCAQELFLV